MKIKIPEREGRRLTVAGMAVGGAVIAVVLGGVGYVLVASNRDLSSGVGVVVEKQIKAAKASDLVKPPPVDLLPPPTDKAPQAAEKQPVKPVQGPPSIMEIARYKAAQLAWDDYYATKLALEKKRVDSLEKGMNSLWAPPAAAAPVSGSASASGMALPNEAQLTGGGEWAQANDKIAWSAAKGNASNYVQSMRSGPVSPYQVMAGTYIQARTKSGITSDAPASIVGQVTSDIYCNTPAGRTAGRPCIPKGTEILISYNTRVTQGECRIQVAADRLVFPDATSMDLDHMPIGDASGYAGLQDECKTHLGPRLLNAVLFTTVQGAFGLGQAALGANYVSGSAVESVAQQETASGMRIPPTLTVRPGTPFNIMLRKDLVFDEPYTAQTD